MDQRDNNSEQESQRVCYNIMGAVALRVDGIEKADSLADKGTKLKQKDIPITHDIARAKIKKQKWQILHKRVKVIFKDNLKRKFSVEKKWTRKAQSLF